MELPKARNKGKIQGMGITFRLYKQDYEALQEIARKQGYNTPSGFMKAVAVTIIDNPPSDP